MSDPKSQELLKQYLAGQDDAAAAIFDRYVERLLALARARISPKLKRRIDPEDVVQSAYRSFFVQAKNRQYQLSRSGDLWRLLAGVTLNKIYRQIEKQTAAKRSIDREVTGDTALANLETKDPTVAEVVAVGEQLGLILDSLSPDERMVLVSTLQGQSVDEIARKIGKSERTVRRLIAEVKRQFEKRLLAGTRQTAGKPQSTRSAEALAPLRYSDYVLEQLLGSGGMGKVYRAIDKRSGKTVAVKALHKSRQGDHRAVAQFVQESQVLAKLHHPNIVGVEGLGQFPGGGYFIVMEFIAGSDLRTRLVSGPLPLRESVSILKDVAAAIQHVHDHGIVHCDLKPANVLIDIGQRVFVTDFGFAFIRADTASTNANALGGTLGYTAPEILRLQSPPTPAADIYALGALLWTLVTGAAPPHRDSIPLDCGPLSPITPICRRCLAPNPPDRYPTASAFLTALDLI